MTPDDEIEDLLRHEAVVAQDRAATAYEQARRFRQFPRQAQRWAAMKSQAARQAYECLLRFKELRRLAVELDPCPGGRDGRD